MASSNDSPKRVNDESAGEIVGIGLPDGIQIQNHNRFSGCIAIETAEGNGLLFFRDGEIIHAEQGGRTGEEAFYDIVAWPPGRYRLQPNVTTTRSTIQKNAQFLLLESHRIIDERRAGRTGAPAGTTPTPIPVAPTPAAPRPMRAGEVLERLRKIPGVHSAALHGKDGSQVGEASYESEVLGGQAMFLSMIGNQLGAIFQAGAILSAVVHGASKHLLLFTTKNHFLTVVVKGEFQAGPVEAEVRKVLSSPR